MLIYSDVMLGSTWASDLSQAYYIKGVRCSHSGGPLLAGERERDHQKFKVSFISCRGITGSKETWSWRCRTSRTSTPSPRPEMPTSARFLTPWRSSSTTRFRFGPGPGGGMEGAAVSALSVELYYVCLPEIAPICSQSPAPNRCCEKPVSKGVIVVLGASQAWPMEGINRRRRSSSRADGVSKEPLVIMLENWYRRSPYPKASRRTP